MHHSVFISFLVCLNVFIDGSNSYNVRMYLGGEKMGYESDNIIFYS
jgi:hypothetical protein